MFLNMDYLSGTAALPAFITSPGPEARTGYRSQKHTISVPELTMIGFGDAVNVLPPTVDHQALTGCTGERAGYIKTLK